jgi:hypothetical protein
MPFVIALGEDAAGLRLSSAMTKDPVIISPASHVRSELPIVCLINVSSFTHGTTEAIQIRNTCAASTLSSPRNRATQS